MSEFLNVKDLVVEYTSGGQVIHAVNGVSFQMEKGETLGLVGETGAGKTTIAKAILQILPDPPAKVRSGEIILDGEDILKMPEKELLNIRGSKISMIFQDPMTSLNPLKPVGDQVEEVLKLHNEKDLNESEIQARVDELFTMVGLPKERKGEYPHQFSGGMKQRVVIAIALACEPELLIADEPTTALDVTIQAQVLHLMRSLKEKLGTSMILITHDLGIVAETCDSVAVMYAGEIVESGSIYDIFEGKHHHPYTEGLFGSIPNLDKDVKRLSPIEGMPLDPSIVVEGCRFADRCKYCREECRASSPDEIVDGTHRIRCNRFAKGEV